MVLKGKNKKLESLRRASRVESVRNSSPSWSLADLKRIRGCASTRRAEGLLSRIRRLATDFSLRGRLPEGEPAFERDQELRETLFRLNPAAKIVKVEQGIIYARAPKVDGLPRMFPPYGLKGGAARIALRALLGGDVRQLRPRDIDVVRVGGGISTELEKQDSRVSAEFMPEDHAHGHGVEVVESIEHYLSTRDVQMNQALLVGGQLICRAAALEDTYHGRIRMTQHGLGQGEHARMKTILKSLRWAAEAAERGERLTLDYSEDGEMKVFDIALQLSRALETSESVADRFVQELFQRQVLDPSEFSAPTLEGVIDGLTEILGEGCLLFRDARGRRDSVGADMTGLFCKRSEVPAIVENEN